ncbi:thymidylate synthase [Powellomyces hirtus]|nr:thymidylate synthase [Powellomyces hirtus]
MLSALTDPAETMSSENENPSPQDPSRIRSAYNPRFSPQSPECRSANSLPKFYQNAYPASDYHQEHQYLSLVSTVIDHGTLRTDRTGTGTLSLFAPPPFRFSLSANTLPALTTKHVPLRIVFEELMFFIRGQTDATILSAKGVKIWDGNGSRAALDRLGLTERREGDLGPVYGFQWRHFGATYTDADQDYTGQGVDQLREVIRLIKENPMDRRIILSAWNPADMNIMALPPCHMFAQFYVSAAPTPNGKPLLSCQLYQRSCDLGLGVPFNITSYAMLTHLLAYVTDTTAHEFVHVMGDAHVYTDHVQPLNEQLMRDLTTSFPKIEIAGEHKEGSSVDECLRELEAFEWDAIKIVGYSPQGKIAMNMSV